MPKRGFESVRSYLIKRLFSICQELGFHILLNYFYSPIPDTRKLKEDIWSKSSELVGIDMKKENQLTLLSKFTSMFGTEYEKLPRSRTLNAFEYYIDNGSFGSVDGEILYCMIRYYKPRRIIEIGSGYSTFLAAQAIAKNRENNGSYNCELIAVEPYPNEVLQRGLPGLSKLVIRKAQDVPLSEFMSLRENDILFIDSSHVLKIGSDVQYEYLEILPRLSKGVIVHCHDILLPKDYHKRWILDDHIFLNEQYLLQAFLAFNDSFEVMWGSSYMHLMYPAKLEMAFQSYSREKQWPVSFWMRKVK